LTTQHTTEQNR
jgi:hypothetical protein